MKYRDRKLTDGSTDVAYSHAHTESQTASETDRQPENIMPPSSVVDEGTKCREQVKLEKLKRFLVTHSEYGQLEYVAINDVIANLKRFYGASVVGTPATQFRWLHLHSLCDATLFDAHQLHLPASVWQGLVWLRLLTSVCDAWQQSMQNARFTDCG